MPDVDLRLVSDVAPYIAAIKEAQAANQGFFTAMSKDAKMQEEFIDGVVEGMLEESAALQSAEKGVTASSQRMSVQLRTMREELQKMEMAGQGGSKAFLDLSVKAGRLQDQIGDVQSRVRILSSDTRYLNAAMSGAQGLVGGFTVAQGAMALFGKESANLQKQLIRVQGSMALLIGLQQVANTLNKDNAFRVMLSAKAQDLYTLAVGKSVGAMKAFRVALLATGIGALVVAIGLLIANWDKVKEAVDRLFSPNQKLSNQIREQKKLIDELNKSSQIRQEEISDEIELLETQGESEDKIFEKKLQNAQLEMQLKLEQIKLTNLQLQKEDENIEKARNSFGYFLTHIFSVWGKETKELNNELTAEEKELLAIQHNIELIYAGWTKWQTSVNDKSVQKQLELDKKTIEEFKTLLEKIANEEQSARLSILGGQERIDAEKEIQDKELQLIRDHLKKISQLSAAQLKQMGITPEQLDELIQNQYNALDRIQESVNKKYISDTDKLNREREQKDKDYADKVLSIERQTELDKLELIGAGEEKILELKKQFLQEDLENLGVATDAETLALAEALNVDIALIQNAIDKLHSKKNKNYGWYTLFGLDPNDPEQQKLISTIESTANQIIGYINQMYDAELQLAEKRTQLLDDRLNELDASLEAEKDKYEKGYANNIDAIKREIAETQRQKEIALAKEKEIQKKQQQVNTLMQISSLVTGIAKGFESGVVMGIIQAVLLIAAFALYQSKAKELANTELAEGAYGDKTGIIKGKRHKEGGEDFLKHVKVEEGESWGVFNRNATSQYKHELPELVNNINMGNFPVFNIKPDITRNQIINIDQRKVQSKLDNINKGINDLNTNLLNNQQVYFQGNKRIEKRGNHTRIIHVKN